MAEAQKQPSVIRFEQEVAAKNYEAACVALLELLGIELDSNFGGVEGIEIGTATSQLNDELGQDKIKFLYPRSSGYERAIF